MTSDANPFTSPAEVRGSLYAAPGRLATRTNALHRARVSGRHAADVIASLADEGPLPGVIADIGCGRGTTTLTLARAFPKARTIAIDLSGALLAVTRDRLTGAPSATTILADFHRLPLADGSCDLVVAAFCIYHSPVPVSIVAEIARCLHRDGTTVIAVKSADSYQELDRLMAASGLDPAAERRPSLYQAAHSGNIEEVAATGLAVREVIHETHQFIFPTLADAAGYLTTSPKYELPPDLAGSPAALTSALQDRLPDRPVSTSSVVTYLVAGPPTGTPR